MAALKVPLSAVFSFSLEGRDLQLLRRTFFLQCPPRRGWCPSWPLQVLDLLASDDFGERAGLRDLLLKALYLLPLTSGLLSLQLHVLTCHVAWTVFLEDHSKFSLAPNPWYLAKNERESHILESIVLWAWVVDGAPHTFCSVEALPCYVQATMDTPRERLFIWLEDGWPCFERMAG